MKTLMSDELTRSDLGPKGSANARVFEFREVTEVSEVEELLALRHRVYAGTDAMKGFTDAGGPPLLMDAYDLFARLFGLFIRDGGGSRPIGTLRIVTLDPGPSRMALELIAAPHPRLRQRLRAPRRKPLPLLELCPHPCEVEARVNRAIVEAGRFAIDPEFRAGRGTRLGLARHVIEIAMAQLFLPDGCDRAFIVCVPSHAGLYERVGFRRVSKVGHLPGHNVEMVDLEIDRNSVAHEVRSRVLDRAADLAATGRVVLVDGRDGGLRTESIAWAGRSLPTLNRRAGPLAVVHSALRAVPAC